MDKRLLIILVIGAIVGLVFYAPIMDIMMPSLVLNTDSVEQEFEKMRGRVELQNGKGTSEFIDGINDASLQSTKYATSWLLDGNSQVITVQGFGMIKEGAKLTAFWGSAKYEIYINQGDGWVRAENLDSDEYNLVGLGMFSNHDTWYRIPKHTFTIDGTYVGGVKVQMLGFLGWDEWLVPKIGWKWTGVDEAYLYSGDGEIGVKGDSDLFERGESITFEVDTGLSGQDAGEGWEIWIHQPNGNLYDTITNIADTTNNQLISWTVPEDAPFYTSIQNQWTAKLNNGLFGIADTTFFTVDDKDLVPSQPIITVSDGYVDTGETITVTATSTPNNETKASIQWFDVWVWYGGENARPTESSDANWIITETEYGSVDNSVTFDFTPRKEGLITIQVNAHDTENRDSGSAFKQVEASTSPFTDIIGGEFNVFMVLFIIILFLGAVLVFMFLPIPIQLKIIISGILIMVAIYLIVTGGII